MYDSAYSMVDTMPMEGIIDTMNVYWREQYGFVDKLQKYVLEWLQTIDTSQAMCKKDSLINNRNDLFMSFNYTDTLEKVYGIKDVLHLHGGIPSCCEIAPIMGHGNKYIIDSYRRKAKEVTCFHLSQKLSLLRKYTSNFLEIPVIPKTLFRRLRSSSL